MTGRHRRALKAGKRELTREESEAVFVLHMQLQASAGRAWLSDSHQAARVALCDRLAALANDGVPVSHLGAAIGVSRQRAHVLVGAGRS